MEGWSDCRNHLATSNPTNIGNPYEPSKARSEAEIGWKQPEKAVSSDLRATCRPDASFSISAIRPAKP